MNTPTNLTPQAALPVQALMDIPAGRRMYWLLRREIWENRSIYIAPLTVAGLFLLGFLISLAHLPASMRSLQSLSAEKQHDLITQPYVFLELVLMLTMLIVGFFYCLDALYGERRDRSILFWKSMPLSDAETVLAKAIVPVFILPLVTVAVAILAQFVMLALSSMVLAGSGIGAAALWAHISPIHMWVGLLSHIVTGHGLYYAPFFGWMLLVSAWARRAPIMWATLPLVALGAIEKMAFNTVYFGHMLLSRFTISPNGNYAPPPGTSMDEAMHMAPFHLLFTLGMWIGLAIAVAFLYGAARIRRARGPI